MRFEVVTLFPELFGPLVSSGLIGKAVQQQRLAFRFASPRDFAEDRHRSVDDTPYGGGSGMVMMPEPIAGAMAHLDRSAPQPARRVLLTPQGRRLTQRDLTAYAERDALMLVCGRYEGVDERVRALVDEEVSLGDFVLSGGEVAAMAVIEGVARLVPGVLGNRASLEEESHAAGVLEYPQYTRPAEFRGMHVPDVLRSGDHAALARGRRKEALRRTRGRRPELLAALELSDRDRALLAELDAEQATADEDTGGS